jgi:hypothetical protein
MNVDTGEFRALTERVAELEQRVAAAQRMAEDAVRLNEIIRDAGNPNPAHASHLPAPRPRHLKAVE